MTRRIRCERGVQPQEVAIPVDTAPAEIAQVDFGYVGRGTSSSLSYSVGARRRTSFKRQRDTPT